jgi:hypothetical protein
VNTIVRISTAALAILAFGSAGASRAAEKEMGLPASAAAKQGADAAEHAMMGVHSALQVENRTDYAVRIWANEVYVGRVPAHGSLRVAMAGGVRLEARADLGDGATRIWGPLNRYINGTYVWTIATQTGQ